MRVIKIVSVDTFTDYVETRPLRNAATRTIVMEGFQVDIKLEVDGKPYLIVFQSAERNNGLMAYNGYEVDHGLCDACQYLELAEHIGEDSEFLREIKQIATELSKNEYEQYCDNCGADMRDTTCECGAPEYTHFDY